VVPENINALPTGGHSQQLAKNCKAKVLANFQMSMMGWVQGQKKIHRVIIIGISWGFCKN